ncbi:hypothetical protein DAPPUDRAFT_333508 [Daphnia pulex]|uniref:Uncharacterized protein n=1 Tax=Daphnia pulex TaxID=6669 RepID=E9HT09_DAPPU|nr:hypothetical protein DAPPUDRAFT_333508 [Daphnia pulex]|eukprot:EFX65120.1 hypothetical protein DAPPUDRAFT_333508 [Daphnia pulex]
MVLKLIVETQLIWVNLIYKTQDLLKWVWRSSNDSTKDAHSHNNSRSRRLIKYTDKTNVRKRFGI